jgi:5,10-methylenetetrahydromethanopterin reductase
MNTTLAPVVEDLSTYIIAGRLKSKIDIAEKYESSVRTPVQGIQDAVDAEHLGFRRIFLSERYDLKEAGAILGAIAARTSRIGLATGVIGVASRNPMMAAALGTTLHAIGGPRFVYGLGRGAAGWVPGSGIAEDTYQGIVDYATILHRLWRGETVSYNGPAGNFPKLVINDGYQGPPPQIWYGTFALPKAARAVASVAFDGVLLPAMLTPEAVHMAAQRVRRECGRIGRDPATLRICASVVTAPDLDDGEMRELCHARAVTYLQPPAWGRSYVESNGWDAKVVEKLREHAQFSRMQKTMADTSFHRVELMEPAKLIPDAWMEASCAIGSVDNCIRKIREFRDAGADEVTTYGSTPSQNAMLIAAWRDHSANRNKT